MTLADLIRQDRFASPAQKALLNVLATASYVQGEMADALGPHGVTSAQYNVLRILRGRHPEPYTCSEIGERLLDRTPDVTRLLVRLEARGLIARQRAEHDRRVVEVRVTDAGLAVLDELDGPVQATVDRIGSHLASDQLDALSDALEALRSDQEG